MTQKELELLEDYLINTGESRNLAWGIVGITNEAPKPISFQAKCYQVFKELFVIWK